MYDPTVGRFTTQDPSEFVGSDENLYRYVGNSPTNATDPTGLIAVEKHGPTYGKGSVSPTSKENNIATRYRFFNWFASDLGGMIQQVSLSGSLSIEHECGYASVNWTESYTEGWARGMATSKEYSFNDIHNAGPSSPALGLENFLGLGFKADKGSLLIGDMDVKSWSFTMEASFDMKNEWSDNWVPLKNNQLTFGAGSHDWKVAYYNSSGGIMGVVSEDSFDFNRMLFPGERNPPPVDFYTTHNAFQKKSNETWSVTWKKGQNKPVLSYQGGYK
jgi:hypothetical protein